ncbi:MAG: OsmC family protein, partial [Bacillota bacterium]
DGRGHSIVIDEPEELGGTDKGMTPVEITLASLAGCFSITASFLAKKMRVDINNIEMEVEGDISEEAMSSADVYSGFQEVRFNFKIDADAPKEKLEKLYKSIEDYCPVSDTLKNNVTLKGEYEVK